LSNKLEEKEIGEELAEVEKAPPGLLSRIIKLSSPETGILIIAVIASCGSGLIFPVFSFLFSEMVSFLHFLHFDRDPHSMETNKPTNIRHHI